MLALDLNLASRPFKNNTLLWTGYVSSLVLLVAFSVWNVMAWRSHVRQLAELRERVGSIEGQMSNLDDREAAAREGIAAFDLKALGLQAFKANEVIEWRVFSWTRLFNVMEEIQPNDVRMTSIRPLFRAGRRADQLGTQGVTPERAIPVSVEGLAKNYASFMDLQTALLKDERIDLVLPERSQLTDTQEILFDLTFVYRPGVEASPAAGEANDEAATPDEGAPAELPGEEQAAAGEPVTPAAPTPAGPAVPVIVEAGEEGAGEQTVPEAKAAVETKLVEDTDPEPAVQRPFVKGRSRAKAKRGGQP
jgi:hypothetical protein